MVRMAAGSPSLPDGRILAGPVVTLRPLTVADAPALFAAIGAEEVWAAGYNGGPAARPRSVPAMVAWIEALLAKGDRVVYAVTLTASSALGAGGAVVGTSSLLDIDVANWNVHLGSTAYAPAVWASGVNPAAKRLLLAHAFEDCGFHRVKIQTDAINLRSQAAITKLGAAREGVLRHHMRRPDGTWRDTVVFSILADEWPGVRERLDERIALTSTSERIAGV
jgi:RimJ/RimL family protein N-acetyltransferase